MNCVSLFSGCGGLDLGLQNAGFKILVGNDTDAFCAESHGVNFRASHFYQDSVAALTGNRLANDLAARGVKEVDLLAGGPPCQPFSKSRFYRKEKPRGIADPTGNETINGYLDLLEELRPRAFLLENVHGFAYKVHREAFDQLKRAAEGLGYSFQWRILNAADFGVPQIRKRFFAVGVRDGRNFQFPEPTHSEITEQLPMDADLAPWVTAGDVLSDLETATTSEIAGHFAGGKHHELLKGVPPGDNYLYYTSKRNHPDPQFEWRSRYWSFLLKLSPGLPSWTIQARRSNNMGPFHWTSRILTVEEVKRLQTFPDDWHLSGNIEQQWKQVGNAVPPKLAQAIGAQILVTLNEQVREAA